MNKFYKKNLLFATSNKVNWPKKNFDCMHELKSAILTILPKSADWLDWPALLVQPSISVHRKWLEMVISASTNQVWTKITIRSYAWSFAIQIRIQAVCRLIYGPNNLRCKSEVTLNRVCIQSERESMSARIFWHFWYSVEISSVHPDPAHWRYIRF